MSAPHSEGTTHSGARQDRKQQTVRVWLLPDLKAGSNNFRRTLNAARRMLDPKRERDADEYFYAR
jgi:hypothetical protein